MPESAKDLKISGEEIMGILNEKPGPIVGLIIKRAMAHILSVPSDNEKEKLKKLIRGFYSDVRREMK